MQTCKVNKTPLIFLHTITGNTQLHTYLLCSDSLADAGYQCHLCSYHGDIEEFPPKVPWVAGMPSGEEHRWEGDEGTCTHTHTDHSSPLQWWGPTNDKLTPVLHKSSLDDTRQAHLLSSHTLNKTFMLACRMVFNMVCGDRSFIRAQSDRSSYQIAKRQVHHMAF